MNFIAPFAKKLAKILLSENVVFQVFQFECKKQIVNVYLGPIEQNAMGCLY